MSFETNQPGNWQSVLPSDVTRQFQKLTGISEKPIPAEGKAENKKSSWLGRLWHKIEVPMTMLLSISIIALSMFGFKRLLAARNQVKPEKNTIPPAVPVKPTESKTTEKVAETVPEVLTKSESEAVPLIPIESGQKTPGIVDEIVELVTELEVDSTHSEPKQSEAEIAKDRELAEQIDARQKRIQSLRTQLRKHRRGKTGRRLRQDLHRLQREERRLKK